MKTKIFAIILSVLFITLAFAGCKKTLETPVMPEGDITEIWFDDTIRAFYPKDLGNMFFSKIYLYGQVETDQPVIFLCSEKLTELALFSVSDGDVKDQLYTVDELNPMEAIVLQEELDDTPKFAISYKDQKGTEHICIIEKNNEMISLEEVK